MQTIKSRDYKTVFAKEFDILVDTDPKVGAPVLAIKVNPKGDKCFIMPLDYKSARDMAVMMLDTLMKVAPQLVLDILQ